MVIASCSSASALICVGPSGASREVVTPSFYAASFLSLPRTLVQTARRYARAGVLRGRCLGDWSPSSLILATGPMTVS